MNTIPSNTHNIVSDSMFHSHHTNYNDLLWHYRLGHVPFIKMKGISSIPMKFPPKQPFICNICPMDRQTKLPFPPKTHTTSKLFELLHVDLWGPYHVPTYDNLKFHYPS